MSLYAVERDSPEALYAQIARRLELEITHLYKAGAALPPETELAGRFGVNRHPLRRAPAAGGVRARLLDTTRGAGPRSPETLNAPDKSTDSKVVRKLIVPASARIAERLAI